MSEKKTNVGVLYGVVGLLVVVLAVAVYMLVDLKKDYDTTSDELQQNKIYFKMEKDIGRIPKGEYQGTVTEIVIGLREYKGKTGIDIREFTKSESYTGPTKKGLRIPADKFEDFKHMINSIDTKDLVVKKSEEQTEPQETDDDESGIDEQGLM